MSNTSDGDRFDAWRELPNNIKQEIRETLHSENPLDGMVSQPFSPELMFDGYAVYCALTEQAKRRTSAENVSDVLDAMALLHKKGVG